MNENSDYSYMEEHEINQYLKCLFCSKPYIDPVRTEDNIQGCRKCIFSRTKQRNFLPIRDEYLLGKLNDLRVQCLKCHEEDLLRSQFDEHRTNQCPKRIVSCSCSWTGPFEDLNNHVKSCKDEKLRHEQFESQLKQLVELFENQLNKNQQLEKEIHLLKKLYLQQMKITTQLQNEIKQYKQMKIQIESLSNQSQTHTDINSIKQLVDQHDIQMKLLVRKQTVVPGKKNSKQTFRDLFFS